MIVITYMPIANSVVVVYRIVEIMLPLTKLRLLVILIQFAKVLLGAFLVLVDLNQQMQLVMEVAINLEPHLVVPISYQTLRILG